MATTKKKAAVITKRGGADANVRIPKSSHHRLALALRLQGGEVSIREKVAELADTYSAPVLRRFEVTA